MKQNRRDFLTTLGGCATAAVVLTTLPLRAETTPNRVGKFEISREVLESEHKDIEDLLSRMTILSRQQSSELGYWRDAILFTAIFEEFDEVEPGAKIPSYQFRFRREIDGTVTRLPVEKI